MHSFFQWLSELERSTQWLLFAFVVFLMITVPYFSVIKKYIIQLIRREKLHIEFFELQSTPYIHIGRDKEGSDLYAEVNGDGVFIEGCSATLMWKVTGARNVDVEPIGKSLKGNSATTIIRSSNPIYTLTATGFNGKQISAQIQIPLQDIFHLDVTALSALKHTGTERDLNTEALTHALPDNRKLTRDKPMAGKRNSLVNPGVSRLNPEPVALRNDKRRLLHSALDKRRILAVYRFTTTKYNQIRHFFNEKETDYQKSN